MQTNRYSLETVMSASSRPPETLARFSENELAMLAKTADAMSAYMGKPVLAEVGVSDTGLEWVTFGSPLDVSDEEDEAAIHVQMGGAQARLLGNRGGLSLTDDAVYDCLYLWAVEIVDTEGERFVKLDQDGEESAWSDTLQDVLPFALVDDAPSAAVLAGEDSDDEDDEDEDEDDDEDDRIDPPTIIHPASPHRH